MSARLRPAPARALPIALAAVLAGAPCIPASAQQSTGGQSMTLEELEAYIAEQKAALERVEKNREITREKERKVREELERREARREALEQELRTLCEERAALAAGDAPPDCESEAAAGSSG